MMSRMETIYDVFRVLVNAARPVLSDVVIAEAHKIIDKADPAITTPAEQETPSA